MGESTQYIFWWEPERRKKDCLCAFVNDYYTLWLGRVVAAACAAVAAAAIHRIFASVHFNDTTIVQNLRSDCEVKIVRTGEYERKWERANAHTVQTILHLKSETKPERAVRVWIKELNMQGRHTHWEWDRECACKIEQIKWRLFSIEYCRRRVCVCLRLCCFVHV